MKTFFKSTLILLCSLILHSCGTLRAPIVKNIAPLDNYKYAFITNTQGVTSEVGSTYGNQFGIYGSKVSKSINPQDIISGFLMKNGYIIIPEIKPELAHETLIVNYGESGRRSLNLGYSIEVTIQFVSAKDNTIVCTTTAEGQGSTESDDIRIAIKRALTAALSEKLK